LQDRLRPVGKSRVEPETFMELADARRSVRAFKSRKIDPDLLRRMIDAVCDAPTGKNSRSVKWLMISDDAWIRKLSDGAIDWMRHVSANAPDMAKAMRFNLVLERHDRGVDPILFDAPHLAVAFGDSRAPAAQYNGVIALTWLELAAPTFGVGVCWAGFLYAALQNWEPLKTVFELPEHHVVHGALMLGYPKYRYKKVPPRASADIRWL
jgi:nitroreductase